MTKTLVARYPVLLHTHTFFRCRCCCGNIVLWFFILHFFILNLDIEGLGSGSLKKFITFFVGENNLNTHTHIHVHKKSSLLFLCIFFYCYFSWIFFYFLLVYFIKNLIFCLQWLCLCTLFIKVMFYEIKRKCSFMLHKFNNK